MENSEESEPEISEHEPVTEFKDEEKKTDKEIAVDDKHFNNTLLLLAKDGGFDNLKAIKFAKTDKDPKKEKWEDALKAFHSLTHEKQYYAVEKALKHLYIDEIGKVSLEIKIKELEQADTDDVEESIPITKYVVDSLKAAIDNENVTVKPVGAGRAFTKINKPLQNDGVTLGITTKGYVNPDCKDLLNDDSSSFSKKLLTKAAQQSQSTNNIALIESGCYVGTVEDYWWPPDKEDSEEKQKNYHSKHRSSLKDANGVKYKCLPNRGGYERLSVLGLSSVSAMGFSGINYQGNGPNIGSISSAIRSIRLLTIKDKKVVHYQIEPSLKNGGIFDPSSKNKLAKLGVTLIQDDQIFADVVVSMGCYGVITHMYITLLDAFWMTQYRVYYDFTPDTQDIWINEYKKLYNNHNIYQMECWFQPYYGIVQKCKMCFCYFIKEPDNTIPSTKEEIVKYGGANRNYVGMPLDSIILTAAIVQSLSNLKKAAKCKDAEGIAFALNLALDAVKITKHKRNGVEVDTLTMSCIEALDFGTANLVPTNTSGNAFNIKDSVEVTKAYINYLNQLSKENYLSITSPLSLRFSKQSLGSVSCYGEYNTGWIEQPIITIGKNSKIGNEAYISAFNNSCELLNFTRSWFIKKWKGKIHWGLWFDENDQHGSKTWWTNISKKNKNSFFKNYKKFNQAGAFRNTFTKNSGLD